MHFNKTYQNDPLPDSHNMMTVSR